jgi:hypothetical protein
MFDVDDVLATVDTVVEKRGEDYRYPEWQLLAGEYEVLHEVMLPDGCHYRWEDEDREAGKLLGLDLIVGEPACLVGAVLAELGILDKIGDDENEAAVSALNVDEQFSWSALMALQAGQTSQDNGNTWGEARAKMRERNAAMQPVRDDFFVS